MAGNSMPLNTLPSRRISCRPPIKACPTSGAAKRRVRCFTAGARTGGDQLCITTLELGAAIDGPGSLLNYQGHPVERLTPDRNVTNPSTDAAGPVPLAENG